MILKGWTLAQVQEATLNVCPVAKVKMAPKPGLSGAKILTGSIRITSGVEYRTQDVNRTIHPWEPCWHFYKKLMAELGGFGSGGSLVLHKHMAAYHNVAGKTKTALIKKGLICGHPPMNLSSTPWVGSTPANPLFAPTGKLLTFPSIAGEPIDPGQSTHISKGTCRPIYVVTASLYILEECKIAAARIPTTITSEIPDHLLMRASRAIQWKNQVSRFAEHYTNTLARNLFDFLVVASFGEARYAQGTKYTFNCPQLIKSGARLDAYQGALMYDPRDLIPKLIHAFTAYSWGGSTGGERWANIARTAGLFFDPKFRNTPIAWIDHVVDIVHNGGLAFNKGYIICNPLDKSAYMKMLDQKRNANGTPENPYLSQGRAHPITPECADLLATGVGLGLIPRPKMSFPVEPDTNVKTLQWGTASIEMYNGANAPSSTPTATNRTEPEYVETYPER
jgi:hypothetical protein